MRGVFIYDKPESSIGGVFKIYDEPHRSGVFKVFDSRMNRHRPNGGRV